MENSFIINHEALYKWIIESTDHAIISKDLNATIRTWNKGAEKIFGYTEAEAVGKNIAMLIPEELRHSESNFLKKIINHETVDHYQTQRIRKDRTVIDVLITLSAIKNQEGKIIGVSKMLVEITPLVNAQNQLKILNQELETKVNERTARLTSAIKELEAFSYSVSHDLRAPLRGIDGWTMALIEDYGNVLDEKAHQYLDRVRSETQRMSFLIDDLLKLSKISKKELILVQFDGAELIKHICDRLQESYSERKFYFKIPEHLPILADQALLDIMLTNLLSNACKFTAYKEIAEIIFECKQEGEKTIYAISDNGVGFNMENAKNLFTAFFRMHKQSEFPGTGIGLAIVQRIINLHQGKIWYNSKIGKGTTFYFTLK